MIIYPIFIPQQGCSFQCIYCNQFSITGSSGINQEEILHDLVAFCEFNKHKQKEIAFFGGTFTALPQKIREGYYAIVEPFLDELTTVRYSTRPDCIDEEILKESILQRVSTIELGVQSFSNDELTQSVRGYTQEKAQEACRMVKENGFKLGIQLMLGLPGFSPSSLQLTIERTIHASPDFVRIYPLLVLKDTPLERMYRSGNYKPISLNEALYYSATMMESFEQHGIKVIKTGLHSDISERDAIIAGPFHPNFGELVKGDIFARRIEKDIDGDSLITVSNKNISLLKGNGAYILKCLENRCHNYIVKVAVDKFLQDGEYSVKRLSDKD
ncbi:MAG: radical SAM protein [Candidatus Cloacimonetes bacterium]|nr:radical SAM protein [Candidatus Cloacimonadota bacterium]